MAIPDEFVVVDVSDWEVSGEEQVGTKPKVWLLDSDGDRWLFKQSRLPPKVRAEDWSEKIATEIARALGVPAAPVELAWRSSGSVRGRGSISKDVAKAPDGSRAVLIHGAELLHDRWPDHDPGQRGAPRTYTLDRCHKVLSQALAPPGWSGHGDAWELFVAYLLLDAIIGNTDRHHANWAVLQVGALSDWWLCPSFDHSTSLGFNVSDQLLGDITDGDYKSLVRFVDRGKSRFAGQPTVIAVLETALPTISLHARQEWRSRIAQLDGGIGGRAASAVPSDLMSDHERRFVEQVVDYRIGRVSDVIDAALA